MKEIKPLTSLRALAALLVFLFHYAWLYSPENRGVEIGSEWIPLMPLWRQGQAGVAIFFVLSGFLITRIYFDKMAAGAVSLRYFLVKRVARIWPLFVAFAIVQHLGQWIGGSPPGWSALVTMSMTQGFFEGLIYAGLPTAWSLTVEESFYLFAPLSFFVIWSLTAERGKQDAALTLSRASRLMLVVGGITITLFLLGAALVRLISLLGLDWQGLMGSRHHMQHATLFGRFFEFAIGIMAAFVHRGCDLQRALRGWRADILLMLLFAGIGSILWTWTLMDDGVLAHHRLTYYAMSYILAGFTAAMILALTAEHSRVHRVMSQGLFVHLGRVSYGFYLIQGTIMMTPLLAMSDHLGPARLPVLFLLTNLICAGVYAGLEVPARRYVVAKFGS